MKSKWIKTTERLPESHAKGEPCAPYYIVKCSSYPPVQAMFIDGKWWSSYISKIVVPVEYWLETNEEP